MDPDPPLVTDIRAVRAVITELPEEGHVTPTKEVSFSESSWIQHVLEGCHPRIAVLDIWAEAEMVLPAAIASGVSYIGCTTTPPSCTAGGADVQFVSDVSLNTMPYDCVLSVLTQSKWAMSFCYAALRAWVSLNAGGLMVLVMRPAVYEHIHRMMPISHYNVAAPDGKRHMYVWRKPITLKAGTRRYKKNTASPR